MIRLFYIFPVLLGFLYNGYGQNSPQSKSVPPLPGFSSFHSNLGIQEIIEVGVPLQKEVPAPAPTNLSPPVQKQAEPPVARPVESAPSAPAVQAAQPASVAQFTPTQSRVGKPVSSLNVSSQLGVRAYSTSNVLRQDSSLAESSGVFESNVGVALSQDAFKVTDYMTMLPRLDLMMQWAWYDKSSQLLNYRFGLVKGGLAFGFPDNWSIGTAVDYNTLSNLHTGEKSFDSVSPSVSLQKIFPTSETSFFMFDTMVRWSNMDTTISFPAAGIFPDSTDNYQNSLSLTYLKMFGSEQQWTIMPRVAINRTNYTKDPNTGRLDYLFNGGLSLIYNINDWVGIQGFGTYNQMDSDDPLVPDFEAVDAGISINANYRF